MKTVFFVKPAQKKDFEAFVEKTKYEPGSLARIGYIPVDGKTIGKPEGLYIIVDCEPSCIEKLKPQLNSFAEEAKADDIIKAVEESQKKAEEGFGALFG
ncbi:MAG: hypothetical protein QW035_04320 [Candidatus Anstonellales archaeon]